MKVTQESKFDAVDDRLVNRQSGEPIPDDEPVFVLRAKDKHAITALIAYWNCLRNDEHIKAVRIRMDDFHRFRTEHADRMKEPDTHFTSSAEGQSK